MDKKNPPKFKSIYVINASSAIHRKYFQMFEQSKFLIEKQKQGSEYLSTFPTLLCDIFCCLYLSYPKAKKLEEIHPKYLVNMTIIEGLLISDAFKRIRDKTCFSDIASIWATELFADKLLQTLTKQKWKRKFKKFDDKYGEEEEKKEENVNMGEPKKKLFDWFPFQFNLPENKKEKKLKKEVKKIQKKMSKYALSATYSISQNMGYMKDVIELCKDWNNKENNLNNLTYQEKMKLANQLKNNSRLRELATLIGHLRDLALSTRYAKLKSLPYEIYNIVLGDDLLRIHPVEITYLSHPTFQYDFYQRLAYKKIMQYELKGIETTGQGSIIVCVDTSGSMSGKPEIMSKGVALGLLEIARADKRNFIGIIFGQKQKVKTFVFKQEQVEIYTPNEEVEYVKFLDGLLEFACSFIGGGTDFETPLNTALSFREKEEIYQDADLVFITDDVCDISSAFLEHYSKLKQKRNFRTYGILIGPKSQEPDTMKKFCDEILNYYVFTEEIATSIFEKVAARSRRT